MSDNWIVGNLQSAFNTWNGKLTEIWSLITTTPEGFRGGTVWGTIVTINDAMKAVGYGLLVLFFAMSIFQTAASITVPQEIVDAIEGVGFLASIPLWLVSLLGSLFITVMSFILILTVYGRFFRLYFYTALAPLPLASFAGEGTSFAGSAFLKSYVGVCLEGAIIVLACLIFSAFMSSGTPVVDTSLSAVTMSWQYIGETIFNMMVLVGLVKGAERIVKEMFGL